MANYVFDTGKAGVMDASVSFPSNTMKLMLVDNTYTPNIGTETTIATAAAKRLGTDLTVPATKSVVKDSTNHFAFWKTTGSLLWTGAATPSSGSIAYQVLYKNVTNDSDGIPIVAYGNALVANGGDITFTPASDANGGLFKAA